MLDVGSPGFSWRRLGSLIRHLPRESATQQALSGETAMWGLLEHLVAGLIDEVRVGNWQRQGDKRAKRPKPVPRPGVTNPGERRHGRGKFTTDQLHRQLRQRQQAAADRVSKPTVIR